MFSDMDQNRMMLCMKYMSPRRLKVSGGWAGVPIEIFVFAPPFVSRFPTL